MTSSNPSSDNVRSGISIVPYSNNITSIDLRFIEQLNTFYCPGG